jgi:riboflavin kinase/FMN adenylyltransferase
MIAARGQKEEALEKLGVDRLYRLKFNNELASMPADDFVREVLHKGLKVREISVGFDFNFGKGRSGSAASLKALGESLGMPVHVADAVSALGQGKCSSSAIRAALHDGRPEDAAAMLGRPFAIRGEVIHGEKIGRTIGFPTANIELGDYIRPADGIYAARTRLADGRVFASAAYVGRRPTVDGIDERLEVNLFDFDEDLYGQVLQTEFIAYVRGDMKFDGLDSLKRQIALDCAAIRAILAERT